MNTHTAVVDYKSVCYSLM